MFVGRPGTGKSVIKESLKLLPEKEYLVASIARLRQHGPVSKQCDGYFRFQCPTCGELRATVNPKNNLAHCFSCGENFNNIDLMMIQGHDFLSAVDILKGWLEDYQHDLRCVKTSTGST